MGETTADPSVVVGRHVPPVAWNALLSAPDVAVIDTRNDYEVGIGSFMGAIDPGIATFRDFPEWWRSQARSLAGKRVAMFCPAASVARKRRALRSRTVQPKSTISKAESCVTCRRFRLTKASGVESASCSTTE